MKVGGTMWYWSHGSQFLEGTRPTGPIGWLRLCQEQNIIHYLHLYSVRLAVPCDSEVSYCVYTGYHKIQPTESKSDPSDAE